MQLQEKQMSKVHVRVKTIEDKIAEYVENNPVEIYVDYRDELSEKQVELILEGKADEARDDVVDQAYGWDDNLSYYWEQCREETGASQDDIDDWLADEGFYPGYSLDDHSWRQLLSNTRVNIIGTVWDAEFNFNNWAYGGPVNYSDVKNTLKLLGINPYLFKKLRSGGSMSGGDKLRGYFPDMPNRVPVIEPSDLWDNLLTLYDGVVNFCFSDLEEIAEVLASNSKNVTIKKGTNIVIYDFGGGAGITETQLTADLTIPRKMIELKNDKDYRYGIQECYGFTDNFWQQGSIHNAK